MSSYKDLILRITKDEIGEKYLFKMIFFPFSEDNKEEVLSVPLEEFEQVIAISRKVACRGIPVSKSIEAAGKSLWNIIPVKIRDRILEEIKNLKEKRLRLRFLIEPYELRALPWESLCLEKDGEPEFLCFNRSVSITHLLDPEKMKRELAPLETLRVLLVSSTEGDESKGLQGIPEEELEANNRVYEILSKMDNISFKILSEPSLEELEDELKEDKGKYGYHIVHFFCHGFSNINTPRYSGIYLKDSYITAEKLAGILSKNTKLVFLASCNTAIGFGYGLSEAEIPAVIGMRYKITVDAAETFKEFYKAISEKKSIDSALRKMRNTIPPGVYEQRFTPVLFLSSSDGILFASPEKIRIGDYLNFIVKKYSVTSMMSGRKYSMEDFVPVSLGKEINKKNKQGKDDKDNFIKEDFRVYRDKIEQRMSEELEKEDVFKVIKKYNFLVIKGDPGSGKSTLLKYIAWKEAKKLISDNLQAVISIPIYLPLTCLADKGDFIEALKEYYKNTGLDFFNNTEKLERYIKQGNCLILLDGLDEVSENRKSVIEIIRDFISKCNCKCILTTRFAGYENNLDWEHYELLPFDYKDIKKFIETYFSKDISKTGSFIKALEDNPQMNVLSSNPLFLYLMCYVYERDKLQLPAVRVDLYEKAIDEMIGNYLYIRGNISSEKLQSTLREYKIIMGKLALQFFLEGKEAFSFDDMCNILNEKEMELIESIPFKSGLIQVLSDRRYIFLHLTFQEYFAACALEKSKDFLKIIEAHLWDRERWLEVILFLSAKLDKIRFEKFINMLFRHDDNRLFIEACLSPIKDKDPFRSILFLSARCSAEYKDIEEKTVNKVFERLKHICETDKVFFIPAVFAMGIIGKFHKAEDYIINLIMNSDDGWGRYFAVEASGKVYTEKVIKILIESLNDEFSVWEDNKHFSVREEAAKALGNMGKRAVKPLIKALENSSPSVRYGSAYALGKIGSKEAVEPLVKALLAEEMDRLAGRAMVKALGELEAKEAIEPLIKAFTDSESLCVRCLSAETLGELKAKEAIEPFMKVLSNIFKTADDRIIYLYVVEALGNIGAKEAVELLGSIVFTPDEYSSLQGQMGYIKEKSVMALGMIGGKEAVEILIKTFGDEDYHVFTYAPKAIAMIGDIAVSSIINCLNSENSSIRSCAIDALKIIKPREAIEPLIRSLEDKDLFVRGNAADALGNIGSQEAIEPLIRSLDVRDENLICNLNVVYALGELEAEESVKPLLKILEDENRNIRHSVIHALGKIGTDEAVETLIKILNDKDREMRENAAFILGFTDSKKATEALIRTLNDDEDAGVRKKSADSLRWIGTKEAMEPLVYALMDRDEEVCFSALMALDYTCQKLQREEKLLNPLSLINSTRINFTLWFYRFFKFTNQFSSTVNSLLLKKA